MSTVTPHFPKIYVETVHSPSLIDARLHPPRSRVIRLLNYPPNRARPAFLQAGPPLAPIHFGRAQQPQLDLALHTASCPQQPPLRIDTTPKLVQSPPSFRPGHRPHPSIPAATLSISAVSTPTASTGPRLAHCELPAAATIAHRHCSQAARLHPCKGRPQLVCLVPAQMALLAQLLARCRIERLGKLREHMWRRAPVPLPVRCGTANECGGASGAGGNGSAPS